MLCKSCKEREAIIFRKYSGEHLCLPCLRKSLKKRLRQTVGRFSLLKEDDKILLALLGFETEKPAIDLFLEMERDFPGVMISCLACDEKSIDIVKEFGIRLEESLSLRHSTRWDLIIEASKQSVLRARDKNFTKVVIPLLLDDAVGLFLFGVLRNCYPALVINGKVLLGGNATEPPVVTPFFRIPSEEIMLLEGEEWRPRDSLLQYIGELEREFAGSRFNILNSYHTLFLAKGKRVL